MAKSFYMRTISFEELAGTLTARGHHIDREEATQWEQMYHSRQFDELQVVLLEINRQLLAAYINRSAGEGVNVAEDVSLLDLVKDFPNDVFGANLYCITTRLNPFLNSLCDTYEGGVCEMSMPLYLATYSKFELLTRVVTGSDLQSRRPLYIWSSSLLHEACSDNLDKCGRNLLASIVQRARNENLSLLEMFSICFEMLCHEEKSYTKRYCQWLCKTENQDLIQEVCHRSLVQMVQDKCAKSLRNFIQEVANTNLLAFDKFLELFTTTGCFIINESLFEWCMFHSSKEICDILLGLFGNDKLSELLTSGRDRWLLTEMVTKKREEAVETVLRYCTPITKDEEKREFRSQLVEQSLSQKMILLLKDQIKGYLIPEGLEGARKEARLYFNITDREGGDEEASTVNRVLNNLGFHVITKSDWRAEELLPEIRKHIDRVKDNCSLLAIFIMAHGSDGRIYGVDRQPVDIGDVDKIINCKTKGIPKGIPKITFIQGCGKQDPQTGETNRVSYDETIRIRLSGKFNFQDYGRVMAAAEGEVAFRNTMMPILMEELEQGGEMADIIGRVRERMATLKNLVKRSTVTQEKYNLRDLIIMESTQS